MPLTLAFDIYGTLIDTAGITRQLEEYMGDRAPLFAARWREKQLEYSFRRGLMGQYRKFSTCTRDALSYTCAALEEPLDAAARESLLEAYRVLPPFADTVPALQQLSHTGHRLYAFSNGVPEDLSSLLEHAGIQDYFLDTVSVHEIRRFKPDPAVYNHFLQRAGATAEACWLISGNPFDVLGAMGAGFSAAWIRRTPANLFDPWGVAPTVTLSSLAELPNALAAGGAGR